MFGVHRSANLHPGSPAAGWPRSACPPDLQSSRAAGPVGGGSGAITGSDMLIRRSVMPPTDGAMRGGGAGPPCTAER